MGRFIPLKTVQGPNGELLSLEGDRDIHRLRLMDSNGHTNRIVALTPDGKLDLQTANSDDREIYQMAMALIFLQPSAQAGSGQRAAQRVDVTA